jgi:inosine/xanthosine triphosphatase
LKTVIIASQNPVKIEAIRQGFSSMFPAKEFSFEGISVPSGVSDQPMSDAETLQGAKNRVKNAQLTDKSADFWVGIEGGIESRGHEMEAFAWIVIKSSARAGKARTTSFFLPPKVAELVQGGMELGDADDVVFGHENSKQKNGAVGLLTGDVVTRTSLYRQAVELALIPFKQTQLF